MKTGMKLLGVSIEDAVIVGDRMDTDIISGIESEIETALVMSGVTTKENIKFYPYRPKYIFNGVGDIMENKTITL